MIEAAMVQTSQMSTPSCAIYFDESERRALDFHWRLNNQTVSLIDRIDLGASKKFVVGGANRFFNIIVGIMQSVAPNMEFITRLQMIDSDEVEDLVVDPNDVPMFWFDDGQGKPYVSTDRRNVWCYERCLSEGNRITLKDIYNPEPWAFEEVDYVALRLEKMAAGGREELETILEEEDDE